MSKEQEDADYLRSLEKTQQESADNIRVLGRRQSKADKLKIILAQALSECGEGKDFDAVRQAIGVAMSKIDQASKKNFSKFQINQEMAELAKTKQDQWWKNLKAGLGAKPSLKIPNIKKEKENDVE